MSFDIFTVGGNIFDMNITLPTTVNDIAPVLRASVCKIVFTKSNGTERTMYATLQEQYLPPREAAAVTMEELIPKAPRKPRSATNMIVWDIEKNDWRSFNINMLLSIEPNCIPPIAAS